MQPVTGLGESFLGIYFIIANIISYKITSLLDTIVSSFYRLFLIEYIVENGTNDTNGILVDNLVTTILDNRIQIQTPKYYIMHDKNDTELKNIIKGKIREIGSGSYIFKYNGSYFFADVDVSTNKFISRKTIIAKDTREKTITLSTFRWNHNKLINMLNTLNISSSKREKQSFSSNPIRFSETHEGKRDKQELDDEFEVVDQNSDVSNDDSITDTEDTENIDNETRLIKKQNKNKNTSINNDTTIYFKIPANSYDADWIDFCEIIKRDMNTVILPDEIKYKICNDYENFIDKSTKAMYERVGIHYKRTYLLYGPPGTGKSSFIRAFASKYSLDIYEIKLRLFDMNDTRIQLNQIPEGAILLLEDIDVLFPNRKELHDTISKLKDENSVKLDYIEELKGQTQNMSGFFNLFDGIVNVMKGCIIFMTTNYIDKIDDAILREGRCDMKIEFPPLDKKSVEKLFLTFYPENEKESKIVSNMLGDKKVVPCEFSETLKHLYGNDIDNVVESIKNKYIKTT